MGGREGETESKKESERANGNVERVEGKERTAV